LGEDLPSGRILAGMALRFNKSSRYCMLGHLLVFFSLSNTLEILIDEKDEIKGQEILRLLASSCLDQCGRNGGKGEIDVCTVLTFSEDSDVSNLKLHSLSSTWNSLELTFLLTIPLLPHHRSRQSRIKILALVFANTNNEKKVGFYKTPTASTPPPSYC
jgi:hypothetical protein